MTSLLQATAALLFPGFLPGGLLLRVRAR